MEDLQLRYCPADEKGDRPCIYIDAPDRDFAIELSVHIVLNEDNKDAERVGKAILDLLEELAAT